MDKILCLSFAWVCGISCAVAGPLITERISINPITGAQSDGDNRYPVLSADGCVVAFVSQSSTLANPSFGLTTNSPAQIYAVDRCVTPHTMELISVTNDGTAAADAVCDFPNISADGRYVAFISQAGNLPVPISAPRNMADFVFIRDRLTQTTLSPLEAWRVTKNINATISFDSTPHRYMSSDASRFVFGFYNSVLVPSNTYVFDRSGGATTMQAVCPQISESMPGPCTEAHISGDGGTVVLGTMYPLVAADADGFSDVFSYDVATTNFALVSVDASGALPNQSVEPYGDVGTNDDGHLVAFSSDEATNFPGNIRNSLLLKDRVSGTVTLLSVAPDGTAEPIDSGLAAPQLSADGTRIVFNEETSELSPWLLQAAPDTLVYDTTQNRISGVCRSASGSYGKFGCSNAAISADGKWAAFRSLSPNLVPNDTNGPDIFVVALDAVVDSVFSAGFEP